MILVLVACFLMASSHGVSTMAIAEASEGLKVYFSRHWCTEWVQHSFRFNTAVTAVPCEPLPLLPWRSLRYDVVADADAPCERALTQEKYHDD